MKFIFGLGNPGRRYAKMRHNLGMMTAQKLAREMNVKINKHLGTLSYGKSGVDDGFVIVIPDVYMNQSGIVIEELMEKMYLKSDDLIVVHDDLDIEFARLKIKTSGGSAGHKGLNSIIEKLGTDKFVRLRMGIGKPEENQDPTDYVLQRFTAEEKNKLDEFIKNAIEAITVILNDGVEKAMNKFNKKKKR